MKFLFKIFAGILILGIIYLSIQYFIKWDSVIIDSNISKNSVYKKIDHQIVSLFSTIHKEEKYTNNVIFSFDENATKIENSNYHNCTVYFDGPFLIISFKSGDGFSGGGYNFKILNGRFRAESYSYTDNPSFFDNKLYDKIVFQKLILNKENYKSGDSIFGKIDLKVQESNGLQKSFQYGKGYFRGLIK